jgi:predicted DNA-binding transcriptional regulator AlpA
LNTQPIDRILSLSEVASLFGYSEATILEMLDRRGTPVRQEFFSIAELATRWRCSRATVYNRLRQVGARVLDFSTQGRKGKKSVPASTVLQIENRQTKRLS